MTDDAEIKPARLFVGLKMASDIAEQLAAMAAELRDTPARLVATRDIHLTLVPPWQETSIELAIERLRGATYAFPSFLLKFERIGYGPRSRQPRLLWADCTASDEIAALHTALLGAFGQTDSRPFRPHVTLARFRETDRNIVRRHPIDRKLRLVQAVRTVELFRSPPPGAKGYQILASMELGPHDAAMQ